MLMRRLSPRDLVFAAALAVPLQTVPNAVRLASLLIISGGERAATAVAPLALITVSSCLRSSAIDTLALRPDGHQHEQQPGWNGRGNWRCFGVELEKKSDPLMESRYCPVWPSLHFVKFAKGRKLFSQLA